MSKLCLGTVQFGLDYGIYNKHGKPSKAETFKMLETALDQGIEYFDTAAAYGNAEELLGEFIATHRIGKAIKVISKLLPNLIEEDDPQTEAIVQAEIEGSLKRLQIESLDGYLLHTPKNFYNQRIMNGLKLCKSRGLVKKIGVSIYETQHALDVVASKEVDYIQVPYSIFDQRLNNTDFFKIARENGVTVFARSAFLQGLILMNEADIPGHLAAAKGYLRRLDQIIKPYGLSRLEAAFYFSYGNPGIDYLVFGVEEQGQLLEDLRLGKENKNCAECLEELRTSFREIDEYIIFPSLWSNKNSATNRK